MAFNGNWPGRVQFLLSFYRRGWIARADAVKLRVWPQKPTINSDNRLSGGSLSSIPAKRKQCIKSASILQYKLATYKLVQEIPTKTPIYSFSHIIAVLKSTDASSTVCSRGLLEEAVEQNYTLSGTKTEQQIRYCWYTNRKAPGVAKTNTQAQDCSSGLGLRFSK